MNSDGILMGDNRQPALLPQQTDLTSWLRTFERLLGARVPRPQLAPAGRRARAVELASDRKSATNCESERGGVGGTRCQGARIIGANELASGASGAVLIKRQ